MKIPCAKRLQFIICGLSFLYPALSASQFNNLTLIATALVLGAKFNLTEINRMWLKEKSISTLSHFLSDAKFSTDEMQQLYVLRTLNLYKINNGCFLIDDTMKHHTNFCKWIHGVFYLFDHASKTNEKSTCIVFLYYSDGALIKFPICFRIFYKEGEDKSIRWRRTKDNEYKPKYQLAIEMIEWALKLGFPKCTVLADAWFGIGPFVKELRRLELGYVLEVKTSYQVKTECTKPKLTPKGRLAKNQFDLKKLPDYFETVIQEASVGFAANKLKGKNEKVLYHVKIITGRLNSIPGKQRIIESYDPIKQTTKYLVTNQLTWEATKIISTYSNRWVIEEFFRNAKQLTDMEGATIRSEQGVTLSLCLVSWIDFLLHHENYKLSTADKLTKESLTIPSIVRRAQFENLEAFMDRVKNEEDFVKMWFEVEKERLDRKRKEKNDLIIVDLPSNKTLTKNHQ